MERTLQSRPEAIALKSIFQSRILNSIPRTLALLDKSPLSESFGSFDRKYWQYKILDFPCGMQQELVLPVAYAWKTPLADNPFYGNVRLEGFIRAAFNYHARSMHRDGSLDDYFPYERALGATGYALVALTEAALMTGLASRENIAAFERSARFIADWRERGLLSNHLAIGAAALANVAKLTGNHRWSDSARQLLTRLTAVQHPEGWFPEYSGCDLGYQTVTIEFLARYRQTSGDTSVDDALRRALIFLRRFLHPDGSLGGEYGSRNTYNFYPGGFALLSSRHREAAEILDGFRQSLGTLAENHLGDDGVFGHMLSSFVTACDTDIIIGSARWDPVIKPQLTHFDGCGLFIGEIGRLKVYGSSSKGVLKIFDGNSLHLSDTGFAGRFANSVTFCQNKPGIGQAEVDRTSLIVRGELQRFRNRRLSPLKMLILRGLAITVGRFPWYSHAMRLIMQRLLIHGGEGIGLLFERRVTLGPDGIAIFDKLRNTTTQTISKLFRSSDCVNTHVITSDSFQTVNLKAWQELPPPAPASTSEFSFMVSEQQS